MISKIIIAGFGGQGILLAGKLLAYSAMEEGKNVTHFPSYGAEVRGGTCNCSVIISDEIIASPMITTPDILLVLNQPSKRRFELKCRKNGIIILNKSLINEEIERKDLKPYFIDATNSAMEIGSVKAANMVMLGALIKISGIVKLDTMINSLSEVISAKNKALIDINIQALKKGSNLTG